MEEDTKIAEFRHPASVDDPLTEIAREGARRMLAAALREEAETFVAGFSDERLPKRRPAGRAMRQWRSAWTPTV